ERRRRGGCEVAWCAFQGGIRDTPMRPAEGVAQLRDWEYQNRRLHERRVTGAAVSLSGCPYAGSMQFDARALTDPVERSEVRAHSQQLRSRFPRATRRGSSDVARVVVAIMMLVISVPMLVFGL